MVNRRPSKPVTDRSLGLQSPEDLLKKLDWEISLFRQLDRVPSEEWPDFMGDARAALYAGINAASTAYHLCDWFAAALRTPEEWQKASDFFGSPGMSNLEDVKAVFAREFELKSCEQICLATKHYELRDSSRLEGFSTPMIVEVIVGPSDGERPPFVREQGHIQLLHDDGISTTTLSTALGTAARWWRHTLKQFDLLDEEPQSPASLLSHFR